MNKAEFQRTIYSYYNSHARKLPWRFEKDPYKILISEVMLQQTQVARVLVKYKEFLERFPTVESLARASLRDVLTVWQGMGYNRRGKYLKEAAGIIVREFGGVIPSTVETLVALPGIGHATASAILAYAFNKPVVFIETNIRAVYLYYFFKNGSNISDKQITGLVEKTLDRANPRTWYYALTDYGNYLKNKEKFKNTQSKHYAKQSKFEGSRRQLRAQVLFLLTKNEQTLMDLYTQTGREKEEIGSVVGDLVKEKLILLAGNTYRLA